LNYIVLQDDVNGRWLWNLHSSKNYIVSIAYNFLQKSTNQHIIGDDNHVFWHKDVPLKVNVFVWRLLLNRLPMNDNLLKRGVILTIS